LRGDHPERINLNEPQPADLPVTMPGYLSQEAQGKWADLAPHLLAMGVLSAADVDMLAAYCECYARWRRLVVMAAKSPPVFKRKGQAGDDGVEETVLVKNPLWGMVRDADAALRNMAREFGLTPSARSGMQAASAIAHGERLLTGGGFR
jgi:P27 family predicted phage terminase small subunit